MQPVHENVYENILHTIEKKFLISRSIRSCPFKSSVKPENRGVETAID
jgi:hypothetical protein